MLTIVVPMCGTGQRFKDAGFDVPKPLVPVAGVPMAKLAVDCIRPECGHRLVFAIRADHHAGWGIGGKIQEWYPGSDVRVVNGPTGGAAETVSLVTDDESIQDDPLLVVNCDQWLARYAVKEFIQLCGWQCGELDAATMTFWCHDRNPKWSFVRRRKSPTFGGESSRVAEVAEKKAISQEANVGVYYFGSARLFRTAFVQMVQADDRVNGEFYVAPVLNHVMNMGAVFASRYSQDCFRGLGTPEDVKAFEADPPFGFIP